ncbi:MAG: tetratricopeptide repeat protein [Alphaproteobacteria bacterium]|nr:tetratricopeptide repeat protein [Alphaproteobacteria bacterium]
MTTKLRSRKGGLSLVIGVAALLTACAPNSVRTPADAGVNAPLVAAEQETSRYGTLLRLASSTRSSGDPAAAVNMYQQAIALERGRAEAYTLLGDTLIELGALDQAAEIFEQSLKRDGDSLAARLGYARALVALKRPEAAIPHYEAVLRSAKDNLQAHNGLGVAYDLAGQHQAAQKIYRDGLAIAPDSMLLRNNLGLSLSLDGQHQDAIELLKIVADEPGARAQNRQNLALAYGLAGDLASAERISRLDLDEDSVQSNLAYFAAIAAIDDRRKRASALGALPSDQGTPDASDAGGRRLTALALGGEGLELALTPTGRWYVNLGDYANQLQAASAWRQLRAQHVDLLSRFDRLAGAESGRQPLLVGPMATAEKAESLCGNLTSRGQTCRPMAL